jgi:hypothetical protein
MFSRTHASTATMSSRPTLAELAYSSPPQLLKVQIAINVQPVIVSNDNNVAVSCEVFAIVGKEIVTAAIGEPAPVHVNHHWAFMVDL